MLKSAITLFAGNLIGKVVGFLREIIIAGFYGVSAPVGAFRIAQTTSLIPVNFFTADSLNAGFIPLYNRYKKISFQKAQSLFWILKLLFALISFGIAVGLFISGSWLTTLIAPGFTPGEHSITVTFIKIISLGIPFYVVGALYSYLAMANNSYFLASIRPTIQSIGMICSALMAYYFGNIAIFAWGFTGAYVFFFLLGIKELKRLNLFIFFFDDVKPILKDFWNTIKPLLLLPIMLQGNIAIEKVVSSYMGVEVVASVEYAKFITETGIVLLAVPLGLVGLSTLSSLSTEKIKEKLQQIIPIVLILTIPSSIYLMIHSSIIISLIFHRGAFEQSAVLITKSILQGLAIGFWAQVASYVLIKALNAQHRNREVVVFMAIALAANSIFNIVFYKIFGPITIGIGASIYGFILFLLTIYAFDITKTVGKTVIWLLLGGMGYYLLTSFIRTDGIIGFFIFSTVFLIYWSVYLMTVPTLRLSIMPLIKKLKRK